ncbi:MAG TPA: response regulator [Fimbriimonadaceae bacterium]|jgi:two-component system response regulator
MRVGYSSILLVEDNPDDEKMTLRALKKCEPVPIVEVVRDGPAAIEYFFGEEERPNPGLVLLDLKLPMLNGLEVLEQLRANEKTKKLPVVVLTSSDETPDIQRAYALGANSYICKPVEYEKYIKVVQLLGIYWLENNKHPEC